mmetsp:Transcript_51060/g.94437  ORF Transcript_51060/g.94437 Transcript_51060/m.94437 type:complete len:89 (+) Transcript_51060:89-355(+)
MTVQVNAQQGSLSLLSFLYALGQNVSPKIVFATVLATGSAEDNTSAAATAAEVEHKKLGGYTFAGYLWKCFSFILAACIAGALVYNAG